MIQGERRNYDTIRITKDNIRKVIRHRINENHKSVNNFCKNHNFEQSALNKFLTHQRDMKLFKFLELCETLEINIKASF